MGIMSEWNLWADRADNAFRNMYNQSCLLEATDDIYIGFIDKISKCPDRPGIASGETYENGPEHGCQDVVRIPLFELCMSWETYADTLEDMYTEIAGLFSQCKEDRGNGNLDLAAMSLTYRPPTDNSAKGYLGYMLGPGGSFHRVSNTFVGTPASSHIDTEVQQGRVIDSQNHHRRRLQGRTAAPNVESVRIQDLRIEDKEMEDCNAS